MLGQTFTYQWSAFSQHFSTNSTYSADNLLTRLNRYIHSTICKLNNIVWWSSWVQINPYISRPFLDHMSSAPCALPLSPSPGTALAGLYPQLRLSFSPYVSSCCLQHAVSWPSSMASTHWQHYFVCWRKRACFELSTWSPSTMMSECYLLAVPWNICTMLSPSLCCVCVCVCCCFPLSPPPPPSCITYYSICCDIALTHIGGNSGVLCSTHRTDTDYFFVWPLVTHQWKHTYFWFIYADG